ncbi:MAG: restriction endonuclease [Ruminococcaceae bacterium]|nr:restriction endonuclease [Oscillospiraceae bacterium]
MLINITDDIVRLHKAGILDRLLCDKTTGRNILWATDAYAELGPRYERNEEIAPELITGASLGVIKTRARKAFEQQTERTRHRAEVFTPLWIVRKMCDHADETWFGYPNVFFKDGAPTERVRFFENSHTWRDYVDARRMEITCGEGPFLVSRYDAATGEIIPVAERVGVLDRKLRVVSENAADEAEWLEWAIRAFQASYGYEWAGDNLLIARVNLLASFREHFEARFGHSPEARTEKKLANIIAWNILQMDGLTYAVPYAHAVDDQISLFESEYRPPPLCRTFNWRARKNVELKGVGTEMKFDFIIGNPPYQEDIADGGNKTYAAPIYNRFLDCAYQISDRVEMIHPARFLFNAGSTPKQWNKQMLGDTHLKVVFYEQDASKVFNNTEIKGGVAITYHDTTRNFGAIGTFTAYSELNSIIKKVRDFSDFSKLSSIVVTSYAYHFSDKLHSDYPDAADALSKGHAYDLKSNVFARLPQVFLQEKPNDGYEYLQIYGRDNNERICKFIRAEYMNKVVNLYKYKVFLPAASGNGGLGEELASPFVVAPGIGSTETFCSIGAFDTEAEAQNALCYIKAKFTRALLSVLKVTQHITPEKWDYVPLQDFTPASDIDWSKPIPEIDQQLYRKYGLDQAEIDFIESHVKEMT